MLADHPGAEAAAYCEEPSSMHGKSVMAMNEIGIRCREFRFQLDSFFFKSSFESNNISTGANNTASLIQSDEDEKL